MTPMIRVLAVVTMVQLPTPMQRMLGADKLKHFLMSAMIQSVTYSTARLAGVDRGASQVIGAGVTVSFGVLKEVHDRRSRKPFSVEDLVWDVAGGVAAASLLNGTR